MSKTTNNQLILIALVAIAAILTGINQFEAIKYEANDAAEVGNLLLTLIFIALVIERAVEVLVNNKFGHSELAARRSIRLAKAKVDMLDQAVTRRAETQVQSLGQPQMAMMIKNMDDANTELKNARIELINAKAEAQPILEDLYINKRATSITYSLVLGLLVAVAGVRIFANLVSGESATLSNLGYQYNLFLVADTLITAMLLAGGADGIHHIMKRFVQANKDISS